jgi:hypothetical protein
MNLINSLDEFDINGIVKIENFIDQKEILELKNILINLGHPQKGEKKSIVYSDKMSLFNQLKNFFLIKLYKKLCLQKNLQFFANKALGHETKLYYIDTYFSKKNNNPILDWHFDQAYSGRENVNKNELLNPNSAAIKFFIYLSDTFSDNGCLSYINGSNKIAYTLKKLIYEGNINYQPYWTLEQFENTITREENLLKLKKYINYDLILDFLNKIKKIKEAKNNSYNYDISCKQGDMIIFDEAGCHRGSKLLFTDRYVLRFLFKRI